MTIVRSSRLYCREGSSDKEYLIELIECPGGYKVTGHSGRRGGALKAQPKTKELLDQVSAMAVFQSIEKEKLRKGYTPCESGVPYSESDSTGEVSGWRPQLPTAISREQAEALLRDDGVAIQEKHDGERRGATFSEKDARAMNKRGLYVASPAHWASAMAEVGDSLVDGEHIGETLYVFDALRLGGTDLSDLPFEDRWEAILVALGSNPKSPVRAVETVVGYEAKKRFFECVERRGGEGVVFRRLSGVYSAGEASSKEAAAVWKFKFKESCTALVVSIHKTKQSVGLALLDSNGVEVVVGNVTVPPNQAMPKVGDLVEVSYLYKYEGGSLFQPVLLGVRSDQVREDARLDKVTRIKWKEGSGAGVEAEETERSLF